MRKTCTSVHRGNIFISFVFILDSDFKRIRNTVIVFQSDYNLFWSELGDNLLEFTFPQNRYVYVLSRESHVLIVCILYAKLRLQNSQIKN